MNHADHSQTDAPTSIADVLTWLRSLAPLEAAESWDNVGFLWGSDSGPLSRVMTCLTLTSDVVGEAVMRGAQLVVTHHPILFRPVGRVTSQTAAGRMLLALARHDIAVYSAHTAYDNAPLGINQQLAQALELRSIASLRPPTSPSGGPPGAGRCGNLVPPRPIGEFLAHVKARLGLPRVDCAGRPAGPIKRVAVACGSGAEFLDAAAAEGCQALITGEARFHACCEAREREMALVLLGHFASERPAMLQLALEIGRQFPSLQVWASTVETDPLSRD